MAALAKKDLYALLEVPENATKKELVKAYRKKALKCHPDKNPDDPKAAELFDELSKALEILTDAAARAAYDKTRAAKRQAEERHKALDAKRRKLKEDLEARETAAQVSQQSRASFDKTAAEKLQAEIERLQKEGSRILEQEQESMREELKKKGQANFEGDSTPDDGTTPKLRVKWKSRKDDPNNGGYSYDFLLKAFSKYGVITNIVMSCKKKGSALVEFKSPDCAQSAYLHEVGIPSNPLTLIFLQGQPTMQMSKSGKNTSHKPTTASGGVDDFEQAVLSRMRQAQQVKNQDGTKMESSKPELSRKVDDFEDSVLSRLQAAQEVKGAEEDGNLLYPPKPPQTSKPQVQRDYESVADMEARRAEERKRLIEQLQAEDD